MCSTAGPVESGVCSTCAGRGTMQEKNVGNNEWEHRAGGSGLTHMHTHMY